MILMWIGGGLGTAKRFLVDNEGELNNAHYINIYVKFKQKFAVQQQDVYGEIKIALMKTEISEKIKATRHKKILYSLV